MKIMDENIKLLKYIFDQPYQNYPLHKDNPREERRRANTLYDMGYLKEERGSYKLTEYGIQALSFNSIEEYEEDDAKQSVTFINVVTNNTGFINKTTTENYLKSSKTELEKEGVFVKIINAIRNFYNK